MTRYRLLKTGALGALATALLGAAVPGVAQEWSRHTGQVGEHVGRAGGGRERVQREAQGVEAQAHWGQRAQERAEQRQQAYGQASVTPEVRAEPRMAPTVQNGNYGANRDGSYGADRSRSYGAVTRSDRRGDEREARQDYRQGYRAGEQADQRSDRSNYARGYREGRRVDDRRDQQSAYGYGYRDGGSYGNSNGRGYSRWDNRSWRNDSRYDWYRYRAANRSLFNIGRYYAPYRNYSYSGISIGFHIGSPFYSSRYWIDDPWRYRLPSAYGPYRWVRYYDDALLVDIYSGEVVDVIRNFFW